MVAAIEPARVEGGDSPTPKTPAARLGAGGLPEHSQGIEPMPRAGPR